MLRTEPLVLKITFQNFHHLFSFLLNNVRFVTANFGHTAGISIFRKWSLAFANSVSSVARWIWRNFFNNRCFKLKLKDKESMQQIHGPCIRLQSPNYSSNSQSGNVIRMPFLFYSQSELVIHVLICLVSRHLWTSLRIRRYTCSLLARCIKLRRSCQICCPASTATKRLHTLA